MIYSTHKHTPEKPRLRLVLPASRQIAPAEYEPVCRYWTARIGIELFDHTTYQLPRLFYWPSTSRDGDYFFNYQDGLAFDVAVMLGRALALTRCWRPTGTHRTLANGPCQAERATYWRTKSVKLVILWRNPD